jgi:hypothetical protein
MMWQLVRSARQLSPGDRRLACEAACLAPLASLSIRVLSPGRASRIMTASRAAQARARVAPERVAAIVDAVLTLMGARCFTKALVLHRMLGRRGVHTEPVLGVARHEGALAAHAWLERNGQVLIGAGARDYTALWRQAVPEARA